MVVIHEYDDFIRRIATKGKGTMDPGALVVVKGLIAKVMRPGYARVPKFNRGRRNRHNAPAPKYAPKPKVAKEKLKSSEDELRKLFNKLTGSKYDALMPVLENHIGVMKTLPGFEESTVINVLYTVIANTPFYSRMYAKCYTELAKTNPYLKVELDRRRSAFSEGLKEIESVNPNEDYDRYCDLNKDNNRRQAMGKFFMGLGEHGLVEEEYTLSIVREVLTYFEECSGKERFRDESDTVANLLGALIIDNQYAAELVRGNILENKVVSLSKSKSNSKPSLTNKSVFKFMDVRDYIRTLDNR
tara:strand:+ start:13770 stop:14672 length:903 start_codon:yes stop_codon:yes gene_type:complete